jgi:hypothetical protein
MLSRGEADAVNYRNGYPGQRDNKNATKNLRFYQNVLRSQPNNMLVEEFHTRWWNNFGDLEREHGFVQWFFPIREQGLNHQAQPLQLHEAKAIREDPACMARFMQTYRLMLHFYGMQLVDETTGEIDREVKIYEAQYRNLETHPHNFLRITRILKCLGELGLDHYQFPFMKHVYDEIFLNNNLQACESSARTYWERVVRDDQKREALRSFASSFRPIPQAMGFGARRKVHDFKQLPGKGPAKDLSECKFGLDQPVRAQWKGKGKEYACVVMQINLDGTYQIQYSDGDVELYYPETGGGLLEADPSRNAEWEERKKKRAADEAAKAEAAAKEAAAKEADSAPDAPAAPIAVSATGKRTSSMSLFE